MDERWIWAVVAAGAGLLLGVVAGAVIRRVLDRPERRPALRDVAGALSVFTFWMLFATGVVVAVSVSSPERLEDVPTDVLDWLPKLAVAGLLLIGGYALGLTLATAVGRGIERASGRRNRLLERAVRTAVFAAALVLALRQIGVDTTIIDIVIAGLVFAVAAAMAGTAIVGGREVSAHVAAGRTVQRLVTVGTLVEVGDVAGGVVEVEVAHLVVATGRGRMVVPYGELMKRPFLLVDEEGGSHVSSSGDAE